MQSAAFKTFYQPSSYCRTDTFRLQECLTYLGCRSPLDFRVFDARFLGYEALQVLTLCGESGSQDELGYILIDTHNGPINCATSRGAVRGCGSPGEKLE